MFHCRAADTLFGNAGSFCIIEGPETVQDFEKLETQEIVDNIRSRRNKIFLLMEEVLFCDSFRVFVDILNDTSFIVYVF